MRRSFGNPRVHVGMTVFFGAAALGFLIAGAFVLSASEVGGGVFLLAVGVLFAYWSWAINPSRMRRIPAERLERRRDRLNMFFARLRIKSLVDPTWTERQGKDTG
jgi:hypothetical protein